MRYSSNQIKSVLRAEIEATTVCTEDKLNKILALAKKLETAEMLESVERNEE